MLPSPPKSSESELWSSDSSTDSEADIKDMCFLLIMALSLYATMVNSFQPIELSRENQVLVNPTMLVNDLLGRLIANPSQFKDLANFTLEEFMQLCAKVVPTIQGHARSTRVHHLLSGHPVKLSLEQRLLNFIIYMEHDSVIYFDSILWNWSRSSLCDDALFVASCINSTIVGEIWWPTPQGQ